MGERDRERSKMNVFDSSIHCIVYIRTFSVVTSADMEAIQKVVVVVFGNIHTTSTQFYCLLHLYMYIT